MAPSRPSSSWPTSATAEAPCDGSALGHMDCRMGSVVVMASLFLGRCHHSLAFLHGTCNQQGVSTDPVGTSKELPAGSLGKWSLYIPATCPSSDHLLDCGPQLQLPVPVGPASRSFFLLVPPKLMLILFLHALFSTSSPSLGLAGFPLAGSPTHLSSSH